ncbi:c-type cytochrome [Shewanella colwelliana]|uniref:Cytochrome c n=1 Tax=Shewanella colwelliana TaxID=23 RepID=A0ABQ4P629_SHECO|nr:c-type cytochrome [Shewanella colwelliana]MCZ4339097.1 c-type cytochrome [Shewanella colwelliana]MDX1280823.1 c-type cytochrome [Shewanella colwelliana]GIU28797.1 cytochrome c [Shewanella colwelliana]GIU42931.1 cytochrome c [Shewanella colwelliana]
MKKLAIALSILATLSTPALAAGDAEAGKTKAIVCSACHGVDGNSMIDMYPKLAGQQVTYLNKQLHDLRQAAHTGGKEGRNDPMMSAMAAALSDQDIEDLSAYFNAQTLVVADVKDVPELGEQLYKGGDMVRGITACIACHGPSGQGSEAAGFPAIAGQHANYIKIQLNKFHDTTRNNDLNGMMQDVAKKLTSEDIEALSKYISSIK